MVWLMMSIHDRRPVVIVLLRRMNHRRSVTCGIQPRPTPAASYINEDYLYLHS